MNADSFDDLLRTLSTSPSRRGLARALGVATLTGLLGPLFGPADLEAKKKKKKCKASKGKKKCGKKCISLTSCCTSADCGGGAPCQNGTCLCLSGFRICSETGACIPENGCCSDAECGNGALCLQGVCNCLSGFKSCGNRCVPSGGCCTDGECATGNPCTTETCSQAGVCQESNKANGTVCGGPCDLCQGGTCTSQCGADQMCLANGSCGDICPGPDRPGCSCNQGNGDPVWRRTVGGMGNVSCESVGTCNTTADCIAGSVCSSICDPNRCIPLCPN